MDRLRVEVIYALPEGEDAVSLELPRGATAGDAVQASGILSRHAGLAGGAIGIFGEVVAAETPLSNGDRVELYRPLVVDPKEARRRRATKAR